LEGLHGLGSHCMPAEGGSTGCPTIFPAPPALGAAFNTSLMVDIGRAISDEVRAMNNAYGSRNYANRPVDLNLWLPSVNLNINYFWGRNIEVYGEDPLHAGRLAGALARGVQWDGAAPGSQPYLKVYATIKHYTGYQVETNRFGFNANVSERDLVMTYLLPFQVAAAEGGNVGVMCA
jgi:beta-glucosidase